MFYFFVRFGLSFKRVSPRHHSSRRPTTLPRTSRRNLGHTVEANRFPSRLFPSGCCRSRANFSTGDRASKPKLHKLIETKGWKSTIYGNQHERTPDENLHSPTVSAQNRWADFEIPRSASSSALWQLKQLRA